MLVLAGSVPASKMVLATTSNGFTLVGRMVRSRAPELALPQVALTDSVCITRWGTTRGLSELRSGPTTRTRWEHFGAVVVNPVLWFEVDADAWSIALALPPRLTD